MESKKSFAETALSIAGKSEEEAQRTGKVDQADDQVEGLFKFKTVDSPIHKAVWEKSFPTEFFEQEETELASEKAEKLQQCLQVLRRHKEGKTLYDESGKITEQVLQELAEVGYWGTLISEEFGGLGLKFAEFTKFLTQVATYDPTIAGLASVHGCIGAVDPVRTFGDAALKEKYLPQFAAGKKLSGFALTEPNAGSDLTALRTTAHLEGGHYIVNGEKLFITNGWYGRTVGLVCLIDNKPAVLIADLPTEETENFGLVKYGIYALSHTYNYGLKFKDFKVPKENLLTPTKGDGLTIAYHGLNLGRVSLCANASGVMRSMLTNMLPWSDLRRTYGEKIEKRELVKSRIARVAGYIVGSDALVDWCSTLLDQGYRGEIECIIAKVFGSERQKEAAIECFMKTHGGRSFIHGHMFGDNIHDFLAPCIYEGEGEMLSMALFKSLIKEHGKDYFESIAYTLKDLGVKKPNLLNIKHLWALRKPFMKYGGWVLGQLFSKKNRSVAKSFKAPNNLKQHIDFAVKQLQKEGLGISKVMVKYQLSLADRQCRIFEMSSTVQKLITMLVSATYASNKDEVTQMAADVLCEQLKMEISGSRASDTFYRKQVKLADRILKGEFKQIEELVRDEILIPYEN